MIVMERDGSLTSLGPLQFVGNPRSTAQREPRREPDSNRSVRWFAADDEEQLLTHALGIQLLRSELWASAARQHA